MEKSEIEKNFKFLVEKKNLIHILYGRRHFRALLGKEYLKKSSTNQRHSKGLPWEIFFQK